MTLRQRLGLPTIERPAERPSPRVSLDHRPEWIKRRDTRIAEVGGRRIADKDLTSTIR
jgi:hypothetical protein